MASGIQTGGVDLDSKFMARVNAKRADVGWQVGGTDISNRYEKYTVGAQVAATGLQSQGTDLAQLFQNISVPLFTGKTVTITTDGTWSDTVPAGAVQVVVEIWGAGAGGSVNTQGAASGGGGGAYCKKTVPCSGGQVINLVVGTRGIGKSAGSTGSGGNGGQSSAYGGPLPATMIAGGGTTPSGGTASGGDVMTTGGAGGSFTGGSSPNGGGQQTTTGAAGNPPGGGGAGYGGSSQAGGNGANGQAKLTYT